ncbi:MAG: hypothetical protein UT34_C0002G0108 [candidate division WS6 bacterium GW2011_GWF2_39_15]|uniref:Putative pre-16S rRNA nuclease n=1 Tax=candidate division WS6 bacterium GW2011_GWF2_39_15 TaxID=1619100 RepID=A0A0G0MYK5_9BACT|nr:MAG: hypothetical protein UT34_C0002G0108 [candidate division WS6 bacterium GW2011_GWF2_39_15]
MEYPVLAIDFGTKRIGLAISDEKGRVSTPIRPIRITKNTSQESLLQAFRDAIAENRVKSLLVGKPQEFEEAHKKSTERINKFIEWLSFHLNIPTSTWDESFSTSAAKDMIVSAGSTVKSKKNKLDSIAASIFLQEFLNSNTKEK